MTASANKILRGLYVITDEKLIPQNRFTESVEQALRGGASIIQYRDKSNDSVKRTQQATALKALCDKYHATLIINDDIELALRVDADGVHLGKEDANLSLTRQQLGNKIIGASCYNQFDLAVSAEKNGADYIAFGSFFSSSTKPEAVRADSALLAMAKKKLKIPVCAIGGITLEQAPSLILSGADMIAVITDILNSNDIEYRSKQFATLFK
ncbi:MAG TPA: thiamine phosphate synthase [Gammaproteobacteria bacterium]|nr:thiamine phosphate synthase [Gammaproteobacteria bacterium]